MPLLSHDVHERRLRMTFMNDVAGPSEPEEGFEGLVEQKLDAQIWQRADDCRRKAIEEGSETLLREHQPNALQRIRVARCAQRARDLHASADGVQRVG